MAPFPDAEVAAGDSLYHNTSCVRCHGVDADGTLYGPSLRGPVWRHISGSYDDIVNVIVSGVPASRVFDRTYRDGMPARGAPSVLTAEQIRSVAAYVYTISRR